MVTAGDLETRLRALEDRAELLTLFDLYLRVPDDNRWQREWLATIFTEDVVLNFGFALHEGLEGLAEFGRVAHARFERSHHVGANCVIKLDGDRANVHAKVIATHVPHLTMGGEYVIEAVRTGEGWRYQRVKLNVIWTAGITNAPDIAGAME